jgi:hypothetical protein
MKTVRQLIIEAFRISGMKGVGDTPSSAEVNDARDMLNGVLDTFSLQHGWSPGPISRTVTAKQDGSVVIANDLKRVITRAVAIAGGTPSITITTGDNHKLSIGNDLDVKINGIIYPVQVTAITSIFTFVTTNPTSLVSTYTSGVFKLTSEPDSYLIDLVYDSPVDVDYAFTSFNLPKMAQDEFYNGERYGFYYDHASDPYPTLWLPSSGTFSITFAQQGYANVTLDTDISGYPRGMEQVLKWRLAADLAQSYGYMEMAGTCLARYEEASSTFKRANHKSQNAYGDSSAPTGSRGYYNIATDEVN